MQSSIDNHNEEGADSVCHVQLLETTPCPFCTAYELIYRTYSDYREDFFLSSIRFPSILAFNWLARSILIRFLYFLQRDICVMST
jgi:hypothetical protein